MKYENDKLNIPEKYRKMSVSELRCEKEKVYSELRRTSVEITRRKANKKEPIVFHF